VKKNHSCFSALIIIWLFFLLPLSAGDLKWLDPDGRELPLTTPQILSFLKTGEIIHMEAVNEGTTGVQRLTLQQDGYRVRAVFRDVKIYKQRAKYSDGTIRYGFKDDAIFEVAAYELSQLLGLDNVPPTVVRAVKRSRGTLQIWIEKSLTEKERISTNQKALDQKANQLSHQTLRLFDNLIYNEDRNQGNILYDTEWKLWMIDHTRSFRSIESLYNPTIIFRCNKDLYLKLKTLDRELLNEKLGEYLTDNEIGCILKRRDLLIDKVNGMIKDRGENRVFFN
jgi:hypothetical protein